MVDHTIIIYYVSRNFVPNLSQVLQLGHTVSANSVSLDGLVHPTVQLRPADVQLVTQSVDGIVFPPHDGHLKDPALLVGQDRQATVHLPHLPLNQLMVDG